MIIGLTGGIGSGKSAATAIFERLGIGCVDADHVAREVVEPGEPALASIVEHFGPDLLMADGTLNRGRLRERIFTNEPERLWLEALLHPLIRKRMTQQLAAQTSPYAILVAPLLFENDLDKGCEASILIDVPEEIQVSRVMARDNSDEAQARSIIKRQMSRADKRLRASYVIDNSGTLADLENALVALHQEIMAKLPTPSSETGKRHDD
ncbi:dephospho-CoA kinase [Saccharospirillum sp. MSK14-1]|uniref:dephospho-CoA kinase n=1 Tax=Saccharospirillum sp. MSK14-1 TaxID=1897632 RepID=UPI000D3334A4|nr:dephospho-CoA kinase [Saccharospirillum sp. MSK14-1]PTY38964.1 dephospho-CoA kinase [Saccharospirillum sp. MSK14-1]